MKEAVIKIEIKVVVEREECGNDGFHTEEKSRDENGDKSLEIDLVKVAIIDLFAKNGLSFDEIEAVFKQSITNTIRDIEKNGSENINIAFFSGKSFIEFLKFYKLYIDILEKFRDLCLEEYNKMDHYISNI